MTAPDFFAALYSAVQSIRDGDVDQVDVTHEVEDGDRTERITVTVMRFDSPATADAE